MFFGHYNSADLKDPNEAKELEEIPKLSDRMYSLMVRNKKKILNMHDYAHIAGSLHFLQGIEYHYNNFFSHLQTLAAKDCIEDDTMLDHEAIAYLNRVGQFYYFAKSLDLIIHCPKIQELYLFRKKSIGHRSIDYPYKEDQPAEQIWQAGCFMRRKFRGWIKPGFDPDKDLLKNEEIFTQPKRYLSEEAFISYQIISNGIYADFTIQEDHPIIIREIEKVYINIFNYRKE